MSNKTFCVPTEPDLFEARGNNETFDMSTEDLFGGGGVQSTQSGLQLTFCTGADSPESSSGNLNDREVNGVPEGRGVAQRSVTLSPNNNSWVIVASPAPTDDDDNGLVFSYENTNSPGALPGGDRSSEEGSPLASTETSRRGSSENASSSSSLASEAMVMRTRTFCLQNETFNASNSLLVLEDTRECAPGRNFQTFLQASDGGGAPTEDEAPLAHKSTFLYAPSPAAPGEASPETPSWNLLGIVSVTLPPEPRETFTLDDAQISSPVTGVYRQTIPSSSDVETSTLTSTPMAGTDRQPLPSLSESPCAWKADGVSPHPAKALPAVGSNQPQASKPSCSAIKRVSKTEVKSFPKPDGRSVRSKVMTRPVATPTPVKTARRKPLQASVPSTPSQGNRKPQMKVAEPSPALCSQASCRAGPAAALSATLPGNTTTSQLQLKTSSRTDPDPAVERMKADNGATRNNKRRSLSASAAAQYKNPISRTQAQVAAAWLSTGVIRKTRPASVSSEMAASSSLSAGPLRKNKPASGASGVTAPRSYMASSIARNQCTQSETQRGSPVNTSREVKKISLVTPPLKSAVVAAAEAKGRTGPQAAPLRRRPAPQPPRGNPANQIPRSTPAPPTPRGNSTTQPPSPSPRAAPAGSTRPKQNVTAGPSRSAASGLKSPLKSSASGLKSPSRSTAGTLKRTASSRIPTSALAAEMLWSPKRSLSNLHVRLSAKGLLRTLQLLSGCRGSTVIFHAVDKNNRPNKAAGPQQPLRQQQQQQPPATGSHGAAVGLGPAADTQRRAQQHRRLQQVQCEALVVVLQKTLAERDEAVRQRREQSQELETLRGELVSSVQSCQRVEQEKEEMRRRVEEMLQTLAEQHREELARVENRLKVEYQQEWDRVQLAHQEEAQKLQNLMEQQMAELKANNDAMQREVEVRHSEHLRTVQHQFEDTLEALRTGHLKELQALDKTRKEAEDTLSRRIQELSEENNDLSEKLSIEEEKRREAENQQTDPRVLYLQQELESLKVVLDMKTQKLHLQENKVLQMDKLTEKSQKLEECLKRVVQENEEMKARMDRHTAITRQLSSEHEVLQESLHKEAQVNKRLSRENEELIWKLHNGDLSAVGSPRRTTSPVSPSSHSTLGLQSPRSPAFFASPSSPVSPR